ncbi:DUF6723 family protein [Caballeronia sp. LZ065]|uniref:DUF6723 family protein n=1 Tax=Caballeronia sp. LZ065 TaxID=3038571 RepID=UPI00286B362C|nr:DUF6723 family protein [Caballeronia sp. LZ065]
MRRAKLKYLGSEMAAPASTQLCADDYAVYASYIVRFTGAYLGSLTVVRKTDGHVLYPFEGSSDIGPFPEKEAAVAAALELATKLVAGDIQCPEY